MVVLVGHLISYKWTTVGINSSLLEMYICISRKKNLYDFTFYGHFFSKFYFFILLKKIKIATNIILPEYGRLCRNVGDGTIRVCLIMLF